MTDKWEDKELEPFCVNENIKCEQVIDGVMSPPTLERQPLFGSKKDVWMCPECGYKWWIDNSLVQYRRRKPNIDFLELNRQFAGR